MSDNDTRNHIKQIIRSFRIKNIETPIDKQVTPKELNDVIKRLNVKKKTPGIDEIQNTHLKNLPRKGKMQLFCIIKACLHLQHFPEEWKKAKIVPIAKPSKDKMFASNYRPISLLSNIGKIYEKILLNRLITADNKIINEQFGFRQKRDTTMQLASFVDNICYNFNINKSTSMLTLDIERSFDTVWHGRRIAKLIEQELPEYLIKTTISYLQGRTFQTTIQDTLSTSFKIPAGVPQGSLLAPTLFTYFINDLPKHPNTELALFADDTAIYSNSFKLNKANDYLQRNITEFEKFYNKWKIRVNTDKTKLIHFTKKTKEKNIKQLTFNNDIIKTEKEIKYLGVILDSKLNFNSHINKVTSKATGAITALYPLLSGYSPLKKELKTFLCKQFIYLLLIL
mgnify:CR=1 FL=1